MMKTLLHNQMCKYFYSWFSFNKYFLSASETRVFLYNEEARCFMRLDIDKNVLVDYYKEFISYFHGEEELPKPMGFNLVDESLWRGIEDEDS